MAWKLCWTASMHASLENSVLEPDSIPEILGVLRARYGGRVQTGPAFGMGLEGAAGDVLLDGVRLTIGWDIWSGLFLMGWDEQGDRLVREIAETIMNNQEGQP